MLCHGTVCVVGKIRDLILQLSKSSIYSTKPCDSEAEKILFILNKHERAYRRLIPVYIFLA
ncbi:hypothetical protein Q7I67_23085, partial [Escherichia coli]